MTRPRPIRPGARYLITRTIRQRQMWLVPSPAVNHIIGYCTAYAAARSGVQVLASVAMSNHVHDIVVDTEGRIPEFTHWRHTYIAKCIKHHFDVDEGLWSTDDTHYLELLDDNAVVDKIAYILANPVAARCVRRSDAWPGLITSVEDLRGGTQTFDRPDFFTARMPATATLTLGRADILPDLTDDALVQLVRENLQCQVRDILLEVKRDGGSFDGRARVLAVVPGSVPSTPRTTSGIRPRFATRNPRLLDAAVQRIRHFWSRYSEILAEHKKKDSDHTAVFPAGSYAVARFFGLPVHSFT